MRTKEIIQEIQRLPINKRILIAERTLKSIRTDSTTDKMKKAAELLEKNYQTDAKLTEFTQLDSENFYEPR